MALTLIKCLFRLFRAALRGFDHDIDLALYKLGVGGFHVDHQVAVNLAAADHRPGGDHIQD
ncbi:hypothetical protein D3C78_1807030 [compost metagenome]